MALPHPRTLPPPPRPPPTPPIERYLAATAEVMQNHYPERQSRILVVNAPWWFAGIWKTVSGLLASGTQAKLQIRGTNFLPTLLEHVESSQVMRDWWWVGRAFISCVLGICQVLTLEDLLIHVDGRPLCYAACEDEY